MLARKLGGHAVVEMAVGGLYAGFEIFRVAALAEHPQVIVGLDHDVVGPAHVVVHTLADAAEVGGDGEAAVAVGDEEAGIVGAVVTSPRRGSPRSCLCGMGIPCRRASDSL